MNVVRRMAEQLLRSLTFLKNQRIIHCDLKPENILLRHPKKSDITVIDLGSSCYENERVYTYIQSRFYRSPEVILGMEYGSPIDMWSFGCILAELYTGYPLFLGEDEQEQLACMMEILGKPSDKLLSTCTRRKVFFNSSGSPRFVASSRGRKRSPGSKDLGTALRCEDKRFRSFIMGCLRWSPQIRMTPQQGLVHPWITGEERRRRRPRASGYEHGYRRSNRVKRASREHRVGMEEEEKAESKSSATRRRVRQRRQTRGSDKGQQLQRQLGKQRERGVGPDQCEAVLPPLSSRRGSNHQEREDHYRNGRSRHHNQQQHKQHEWQQQHNYRHQHHRPHNQQRHVRAPPHGASSNGKSARGAGVAHPTQAARKGGYGHHRHMRTREIRHSEGVYAAKISQVGGASARRRRLYEDAL